MNHPELDFMIEQARRHDEYAAAAQNRLMKEALQRNHRPIRVVSLRPLAVLLVQGLAWLGHLLTDWSCSLQSRYLTDPRSTPCANP